RGRCAFYECEASGEQLLALGRALIADRGGDGVKLLARTGGEAVGFATIYWSWATTIASRIGVMNDLFVTPPARGTGAAEQLIHACVGECGKHGAAELTWQTAPDNGRAQRVYDRVGATRSQWVDYSLTVRE